MPGQPQLGVAATPRVIPAGFALSGLFVVSYLLCIAAGLVLPAPAMHAFLTAVIPWFRWLDLGSFVLGLVFVAALGWYAAAVFVPLYTWALRRFG
jgi:hypothetical protein